jgi:hypothetical protein
MTIDEFILELEQVHLQFEWVLRPEPGPVPERRSKARLALRAQSRSSSVAAVFDPIGAVCYARTGKIFPPMDWPGAGKALGIMIADAATLFAVSTDRTWGGPTGHRKPVPELIAMRRRMIGSVGLVTKREAPAEN